MIPKPVKQVKEPKPLQRKTPLQAKKPLVAKTQFQAKTPLKPSTKPMKTRKRLMSTPDLMWQITRDLWFEANPPDLGPEFYQCRLCPYAVHFLEATLDHIKPKGRFKELKYDLENLQPAHATCNARKGSMTMERYEERYGLGGSKLVGLTA